MKLLYIVVLVAVLKYAEAGCYSNGTIEACNTTQCTGSCDTGQCFCIDNITPCVPTAGECISSSNDCCPSGLYYDRDSVCCTETPVCNPPCFEDETCSFGDNGTFCVTNTTYFKGKTINDLKPSLECYADVMIVTISQGLLTYLKYNDSSMQLADNSTSCLSAIYPLENTIIRMEAIQIKVAPDWCGNIVTNDSKKIYFTNTLHIYPLASPLITRNPLSFDFTCAYNLTMQLSLNISIHPIIGSINLPGLNGAGSFAITMAAYWNPSYTEPITQDQTVTVGKDFYLGLFATNANGDLFTLRVEKCVASPTSDRNDASVNLVTGGCAAGGDVATVVEENGVSLEARIKVTSFKFQSANLVYIFCDVRLCDKNTDCTKCDNSRAASSLDTGEVMIQLPYSDYTDSSSSVTNSALPWAVLCSTFLGFLSMKLY